MGQTKKQLPQDTVTGPKCPECGSATMLYCYPHQHAGLWECENCGASDTHEHEEIIAETIEVDTMRNGEHDTYLTTIHVCDTCGIQVDWGMEDGPDYE